MSHSDLYHAFLPNGEFWLSNYCTCEIRQVGAIVCDPEYKERKFHKWNGENWESSPLEQLPIPIKAFLLIYSIPIELREHLRNSSDSEPVYICKWR